MRGDCLLGWILWVAVMGVPVSAVAATGLASLELAYDDNPFQRSVGRRPGWVNRVFVSTRVCLWKGGRGAIHLDHQGGLKRFWRRDGVARSAGDVMANQFRLSGGWKRGNRLAVRWEADLKLKNVQRVETEESYLRGGLTGALEIPVRRGMWIVLAGSRSADDSRDSSLVDLTRTEAAVSLRWSRGRRLAAHLGLRRSWCRYDRPRLGSTGTEWIVEGGRQRDRLWRLETGLTSYGPVLMEIQYARVEDDSNSLGYGYRAHCLRWVLARRLTGETDAHLYLSGQRRTYDERPEEAETGALEHPLLEAVDEVYEQALLSLRIRRRIGGRCGLSGQYRWTRNGGVNGAARYRQQVYSMALDWEI